MELDGKMIKVALILIILSTLCSIVSGLIPIFSITIPKIEIENVNQGYAVGFILIWISSGIRLIAIILNCRLIQMTNNYDFQ